MRFTVFTIFPEFFDCFLKHGVFARAVKSGKIRLSVVDLRDYAVDKHRTVDDVPYGGGPGMVLKPEPIFRAYDDVSVSGSRPYVILTEPWGDLFNHSTARELSGKEHVLIICGRYGGVDERVRAIVDAEISVGDYVLSGGELASMVIMDATARFVPGVLGNEESVSVDSFSDRGLLGYPNYTRPAIFRGMKVPDVLLSGNHREIRLWRKRESLRRTLLKKPELIETLKKEGKLTAEELDILREIEG